MKVIIFFLRAKFSIALLLLSLVIACKKDREVETSGFLKSSWQTSTIAVFQNLNHQFKSSDFKPSGFENCLSKSIMAFTSDSNIKRTTFRKSQILDNGELLCNDLGPLTTDLGYSQKGDSVIIQDGKVGRKGWLLSKDSLVVTHVELLQSYGKEKFLYVELFLRKH